FVVSLLAFGPHHFVLVGVRFNLGPVYEVMLQLDLAHLDQVLQHLGEHFVNHPQLLPRATQY
ncbi:MAG: hypothetical protein ACD_35C00068G0001, partial [uncultured bacterium]